MWTLLVSLGTWNWFIAGGLLLLAEIIAPGTFMLWLGLSALLVGLISLVVDWPWQAQFVTFAVTSVAMTPLWRRVAKSVAVPTDQPFLNRRADAFVGRVFTLDKPIVDGSGTVAIDDTVWRVRGPDCPAGSRVKVMSFEGGSLRVDPTAT